MIFAFFGLACYATFGDNMIKELIILRDPPFNTDEEVSRMN